MPFTDLQYVALHIRLLGERKCFKIIKYANTPDKRLADFEATLSHGNTEIYAILWIFDRDRHLASL